MFLSVIIPVYNCEAYLGQCLQSLLDQDIPYSDYEILCIDDGSRDGSAAVVRQFMEQHSNIFLLEHANQGVSASRNTGLFAARGDYIWFVDSDDFVRPGVLASLRRAAQSGAWDRLTFGGYQFTDQLTQEEEALSRRGQLPINTPWQDAVVWRNLLRRSFLLEKGLSFRYPQLTHGEDGLFLYEVIQAAPSTLSLEDVVYFYRVHSGSAETSLDPAVSQKRLHSHIDVLKILEGYYAAGKTDTITANKIMANLWNILYEISTLPAAQSRAALEELKKAGLFPFRRPEKCDLTSSYMTQRQDLIGRAFDWLCMHLHTAPGFALMVFLQRLRSRKHP